MLGSTLTAQLQRIAPSAGVIGGLLGGLQVATGCAPDIQNLVLGAFLYSESAAVQAASINQLDILTPLSIEGNLVSFGIQMAPGFLDAALRALFDQYRGSDGRVTLAPKHPEIGLDSFSVDYSVNMPPPIIFSTVGFSAVTDDVINAKFVFTPGPELAIEQQSAATLSLDGTQWSVSIALTVLGFTTSGTSTLRVDVYDLAMSATKPAVSALSMVTLHK